jgi:hypothetical protein
MLCELLNSVDYIYIFVLCAKALNWMPRNNPDQNSFALRLDYLCSELNFFRWRQAYSPSNQRQPRLLQGMPLKSKMTIPGPAPKSKTLISLDLDLYFPL